MVRADPHSRIGDAEPEPPPAARGPPARADSHRSLPGELHGVAEQVHQHLPQARHIAHDQGRRRRVELDTDPQAVRGRLQGDQARRLLHQPPDRQGLGLKRHAAGLELGIVEHVVDDRGQGLAGF